MRKYLTEVHVSRKWHRWHWRACLRAVGLVDTYGYLLVAMPQQSLPASSVARPDQARRFLARLIAEVGVASSDVGC